MTPVTIAPRYIIGAPIIALVNAKGDSCQDGQYKLKVIRMGSDRVEVASATAYFGVGEPANRHRRPHRANANRRPSSGGGNQGGGNQGGGNQGGGNPIPGWRPDRDANSDTHRDANSDTHRDANSDTHRNE